MKSAPYEFVDPAISADVFVIELRKKLAAAARRRATMQVRGPTPVMEYLTNDGWQILFPEWLGK